MKDCQEVSHVYDRPQEPSAFGLHNTVSGPFYDQSKEPANYVSSSNYGAQDLDDWSTRVPSNVGKQGRDKDRAKLEKRFREQEANDVDWFANPRNAKNRNTSNNVRSGIPPATFGVKPTLLDRISGSKEGSRWQSHDHRREMIPQEIVSFRGAASASRKHDREICGYSAGRRPNGQTRDHRHYSRSGSGYIQERNRSYERDRGRHREEPRYRGGYSR